jgi:opacity protein-like surface antigen
MSRATTLAITGLMILVLVPIAPARADQQSNAIGGTVATATALAMACGTMALTGKDDDAEHPFARRGPLLTIGANAAVGPLGDGSKAANASYGLNASAGYRCNRRVATEVEVEWLGGYEPTYEVDLDPVTVTSNARVYVLTGRLQPYVLFGAGIMWVSSGDGETGDGDTGMAIRAGAGVDFYLTKSVLLNGKLDYVRAFQQISGTDYLTLSLGAGYRF